VKYGLRKLIFPDGARATVLLTTFLGMLALSARAADPMSAEFDVYRGQGYLPIADEQGGGRYGKNRYLVVHTIYINKNDSMILDPGATVQIKEGAGIEVNGVLRCEGTADEPVCFEPYPGPSGGDARRNNAGRWTGIIVADSAGFIARHTRITGSQFGLKAGEASRPLQLDSVTFIDNEICNFKLGRRIIDAADDVPFHFPTTALSDNTAASRPRKPMTARAIVRWGCAGAVIAGTATAITAFQLASHYDTQHRQAGISPSEADRYYAKRRNAELVNRAGWGVAALGAIGFGVTFLF